MKKTLLLATTALAVAVAFGFPADAMVRADVDPATEIAAKQERMVFISDETDAILAGAKGENDRALTEDETKQYDTLSAEFSQLMADISRLELKASQRAVMAGTRGRQVDPAAGGGDSDPAGNQTPAQRAAVQARARSSVPAQPKDPVAASRGGFQSYGQYLKAVMAASGRGAQPDPRLVYNAPTTYGNEGVGADGGFAVPPDFRTEIVKKIFGEDSLMGLTDQLQTSSNTIEIPTDETAPWDTSGGIQAYWESEGGQKTQSKPALTSKQVKANKIIALVPMTDELLQDASAMASYVSSRAPEKIMYKVDAAILNGTGVGMPLGILQGSGLVTVTADSGQAADSLSYSNILNMYYRMYAPSRKRAIWLFNGDTEALLPRMQFMNQGSGNAVPVYLPPGGASSAPYGTLLGRPIYPHEAMPAVGDAGDVIFADMKAYLTLTKGGMRQDVSMHLFFDYDMTAFRFVLRVGGQPWWNSAVARPSSQPTRGHFVALGARA